MSDSASRKIEVWLEGLVSVVIGWASHVALWPRPAKRAFVIIGDALLCVLAVWLAFSLRLGEWRLLDHWAVMRFTLSMLLVWFPVAWYQGVYNTIFRYTGRGAIVSLTLAVGTAALPLILVYLLFDPYPGVPRTVSILAPLLFLMMMAGARISGRYVLIDLFHSRPIDGGAEKRTLIYGAGSLGQRLAASLASERGMRMVGYVDDDPSKRGQRLDAFPVWHSSDISAAIARTGATDVLLAVSDATRRRKQEIVDSLRQYPVEVRILPPMRELITGRVTLQDLRPIEIEDLLGRAPVEPDRALLSRAVTGKVILITGAGGSIGSEICRQVVELAPEKVILADVSEFALYEIHRELNGVIAATPPERRPVLEARLVNVADAEVVDRLFSTDPPHTVFHAAAYKHVPLIEKNVLVGVANNLRATWNCALAAERAGTERFILVSTDKAVRPPNVMGASKRVCELMLQALHHKGSKTLFAMVRFGNVLGSSGSVVPLFRGQISRGGPVTITDHEVTRYFMTIPEAAQLVIQAAGLTEGGDVFVLDMGEPVRIIDLARSMIRLAGLTVREPENESGDIEIVEIGLRQGEKLHEELLIGEVQLPTAHPRIMRARETFLPMTALAGTLTAIEQAVALGDAGKCRSLLRDLVPSLIDTPVLDRHSESIVAGPLAARCVAVPDTANGQS
jgi:FlaA1/EpsC-like NDP-sugar epimerase